MFKIRTRGVAWDFEDVRTRINFYCLGNAISWFFCGAFSINNAAKMQ